MSASEASVFTYERTFDAPRDLVWAAHSQAEHLQHWWGPKGCSLDIKSLEFRPGGLFLYAMRYATGAEMWGRFFYRSIDPMHRIIWLNSFSNPGGGITRAPFSADCPLEMENTITFAEHGRKTRVHLVSRPFGATPQEEEFYADLKPSLGQGFGGTFDQLEAHLRSRASH